eukprot:gene29477-5824_t
MAILERLLDPQKQEIIYAADFPELPMHIIERIVDEASGTCREYVQNKLVGKEFNTEPYQLENDGFEDADNFFEYTVGTRTLSQLKNPESDKDIAFAKQFVAFFEAELEKNTEFLKVGAKKATRARRVNLLVYKVIVDITTIVADSDSLRDIRDKLHAFMAPSKLLLSSILGQDRLFISNSR